MLEDNQLHDLCKSVMQLHSDLLMIDSVGENGLVIWINDPLRLIWIFGVSLMALFAFAAAMQGFFAEKCSVFERLVLLALCIILFRPILLAEPIGVPREAMQAVALAALGGFYALQRFGPKRAKGSTPG